jgi:hypothetical protein
MSRVDVATDRSNWGHETTKNFSVPVSRFPVHALGPFAAFCLGCKYRLNALGSPTACKTVVFAFASGLLELPR